MTTSSADGGIRDPDDSGRWLVRPWSATASFHEILQHFTSCSVWTSPHWWNADQQLAFFEGYLSAMEAAPKHELTHVCDWQWYEELRGYVASRVAKYRREGRVRSVLVGPRCQDQVLPGHAHALEQARSVVRDVDRASDQ